jgi:pilus assembly protein FimV
MLGAPAAHAIGVGQPQTLSVLGQPLNLVFPVRLNAGEALSAECVRVEVLAGDARLPAGMLQLHLEGESETSVRAVRLQSLVQINEPLVSINLSLGCPARFTRQYTAFVDPPANALQPPEPVAAATVQTYSPVLQAALATAQARPADLLAAAPAASAPSAPRLAQLAAPAASAPEKTKARASKPKNMAARPARSAAPKPAPRLQLDAPEVLTAAVPASAVVATAAAAASMPASAAAPDPQALERLANLEQSLLKMQAEQRATQDQLGLLQVRLAQAQGERYQNPLVYGLGLLSLALALGTAYLWRSRRSERSERESAWWDEVRRDRAAPAAVPAVAAATATSPAQPAPMSETPDVPGAPKTQQDLTPENSSAAPIKAPVELEPISFQLVDTVGEPDAAPAQATPSAAAQPRVTVEELIDLEQQIDFFLVLGQDEAAIDLLQNFLQGHGSAVALPYLMLLELLQKRADEAAFAATAQRMAQRFGGNVPSWDFTVVEGEGLAAWPQMLARLQARWRDSGASMSLLQGLLTGPAPDADGLLDLQTYRDLLLLYALARDLSEHEVGGEEIDLFLPLDTPAGSAHDSAGMMATMAWQMPGSQPGDAPHALEVDISLDDPEPRTTR